MKDTKIFVATHKKIQKPSKLDDSYSYILCGKGIGNDFDGVEYSDDKDQNISDKNKYYSELTGLYWIWKNFKETKNIGLMHYRRFLLKKYRLKVLKSGDFTKILKKYDIILPKKQIISIGVKNELFRFVSKKYYDLIKSIVLESGKIDECTFNNFMDSRQMTICNMFVASKELMDEYFEWLFDILFELENRIKLDDSNYRIMGYISEWLFNLWIIKRKFKCYYTKMLFIKDQNSFKNKIVKKIVGWKE